MPTALAMAAHPDDIEFPIAGSNDRHELEAPGESE